MGRLQSRTEGGEIKVAEGKGEKVPRVFHILPPLLDTNRSPPPLHDPPYMTPEGGGVQDPKGGVI